MSPARKSATNSYLKLAALGVGAALIAFGIVFVIASNRQSGKKITGNICPPNITCVALKKNKAEPDVVTVPVGDYVQFNSADGQMHNIGIGVGDKNHDGSHEHKGTYVSGDFKGDEAWKVQFKDVGIFELHDHYNPELNVSIIVYTPRGDYKIK